MPSGRCIVSSRPKPSVTAEMPSGSIMAPSRSEIARLSGARGAREYEGDERAEQHRNRGRDKRNANRQSHRVENAPRNGEVSCGFTSDTYPAKLQLPSGARNRRSSSGRGGARCAKSTVAVKMRMTGRSVIRALRAAARSRRMLADSRPSGCPLASDVPTPRAPAR